MNNLTLGKLPLALVSALFLSVSAYGSETVAQRLVVDNLKVQRNSLFPECEVVGRATNVSGKLISEAFIKINLYDKDKALVGNTILTVKNIEPDTKWKF